MNHIAQYDWLRGLALVVTLLAGHARPVAGAELVPELVVEQPVGTPLQENRTVAAWGRDHRDQNSVPWWSLEDVRAIAAGDSHSVALESDGKVQVWGNHAGAPFGLTNVAAIAAGYWHTLALRSNGTVMAWGAGSSPTDPREFDYGLSLVPAGLSGVKAVSANPLFPALRSGPPADPRTSRHKQIPWRQPFGSFGSNPRTARSPK